jgi:hypothetical protein
MDLEGLEKLLKQLGFNLAKYSKYLFAFFGFIGVFTVEPRLILLNFGFYIAFRYAEKSFEKEDGK